MTIHQILKQYWGFDSFRPLQEDIINAILTGKDTLALLPTGGGKSVCFQVPAMASEGLCLVVSPLVALMKDQTEHLKQKGIPVLSIYAGMSFFEIKRTLQNAANGNYKFLYVSPERLETSLFLEYLPAMHICMLVVDEAHCISQWGYDFRPTYIRIAAIREQLPGIPVMALTASATQQVQDDICEKLLFGKTQQRFRQSFERPNLSYSVFKVTAKRNKLLEILKNVTGSAIVYCKSRRQTKEIAAFLLMNKINADFYHAGLQHEERNKKQENWISNHIRVIVCTNAFGMGIDKPDVRTVVHYDIPDCLENYYQESGRAGRDGRKAYAVLLYSNNEPTDLLQQSDIRYPTVAEIKKTYIALMNYLQVAAGTGEGISYDFDMAQFIEVFKLNLLSTSYAIKALEQEGLLSFNEVFFKPSTVVFTSSRDQLNEFEKQAPLLEPLIKGLLRSYEGIVDFPSIIQERQLAKFIGKDVDDIKKELKKLNDHGIISYTPQKDNPQLLLLLNRMYTDSYKINTVDYLRRKKNFDLRAASLINYIHNIKDCRSQIIAKYFNADTIQYCGICDNCINVKAVYLSREEFEKISDHILQVIKGNAANAKEILDALHGIKKEKIWKVIDYLIGEKKLRADDKGKLSIY